MQLDAAQLETLKRTFLAEFPDFEPEGFAGSSSSFFRHEVEKHAYVEEAQALLSSDQDNPPADLGAKLLGILGKSKIPDQYLGGGANALRKLHPSILEGATASLVSSELPAPDSIQEMRDRIQPIAPDIKNVNKGFSPNNVVRCIPSMLLALAKPRDALCINTDPLWKVFKKLTGKKPWGDGPSSAAEYTEILRFADALFAQFEAWGWRPRDYWDVRSFIFMVATSDAADQSENQQANDKGDLMTEPTNLILYGPPGTGKTYATAAEAIRLCGEQVPADRHEVMALYRSLYQKGRIAFVTFHQNFSYEDFVEGLRPVMEGRDEEGGSSAGFSLQPQDGIFKLIADLAASNHGRATNGGEPLVDRSRKIFKMSLGRSWASEDDAIYQDAIRNGYVVLGWGGGVDWSDARYDQWDAIKERWRQDHPEASGNDPNMSQMYAFRINMQIGSLVVISDGNRKFRAVGEITGPYQFVPGPNGEYNHRRSVRWLWHSDESLPRELIYGKELSQVSAYQMNSRHVNWDGLEQIVAGGGGAKTTTGAPEPFVLIIDEINRANISKVFGELITLLEPDKRLGRENELTVRLPYSKQEFGVPANLHIIGTMNTADRSIALLDTALRRRFEFRELMPDPRLLKPVDGIDIALLLATINERIEYLFDREHQIGHAYFIRCETRADVDEVMRHKVIPLLAEYFYEDWAKVAAVLGDGDDGEGDREGRFIDRRRLGAPKGMGSDEDTAPRYRWSVRREDFSYDGFAAA
jgi:5-methylcytosine-specific restriction protein B